MYFWHQKELTKGLFTCTTHNCPDSLRGANVRENTAFYPGGSAFRKCIPFVKDLELFTGRNKVVAKVMFLHVSVILFTGGVSGQGPPRTRQTPPHQADTPPPPAGTRQTPPPPDQADKWTSEFENRLIHTPINLSTIFILFVKHL